MGISSVFLSIFSTLIWFLCSQTPTLSAPLTTLTFPGTRNEVLWYSYLAVGSVFGCSISVPTDYEADAVFIGDVADNMIYYEFSAPISSHSCRQRILLPETNVLCPPGP